MLSAKLDAVCGLVLGLGLEIAGFGLDLGLTTAGVTGSYLLLRRKQYLLTRNNSQTATTNGMDRRHTVRPWRPE